MVVDGDVRTAARKLGRAAGGASFELSDQYGAWRVVARDRSWQVDVVPLQGGSLESDLAARDLTVNAMAEPVAGGELIDPHGGAADLAARRLRMVSAAAFDADPLRVLRVVRLATELGFDVEPATAAAAAARAPRLPDVAPERVFAELKRVIGAEDPLRGLALMDELALTAAGAARARRAARRRPEPLPPPRRPRAHARGAPARRRPRARSGERRSGPSWGRASRRCSPSRWPTS